MTASAAFPVGALVATRAQAVHAYALGAGVQESRRVEFVAAVLSAARGLGDVDDQLLAAAREACGSGWAGRRRHRRGTRRFRHEARAALPLEVAVATLFALDPQAAPVAVAAPAPLAAAPAPARAADARLAAGRGRRGRDGGRSAAPPDEPGRLAATRHPRRQRPRPRELST